MLHEEAILLQNQDRHITLPIIYVSLPLPQYIDTALDMAELGRPPRSSGGGTPATTLGQSGTRSSDEWGLPSSAGAEPNRVGQSSSLEMITQASPCMRG